MPNALETIDIMRHFSSLSIAFNAFGTWHQNSILLLYRSLFNNEITQINNGTFKDLSSVTRMYVFLFYQGVHLVYVQLFRKHEMVLYYVQYSIAHTNYYRAIFNICWLGARELNSMFCRSEGTTHTVSQKSPQSISILLYTKCQSS